MSRYVDSDYQPVSLRFAHRANWNLSFENENTSNDDNLHYMQSLSIVT